VLSASHSKFNAQLNCFKLEGFRKIKIRIKFDSESKSI